MEYALTNDEEVLMNLLSILPIFQICQKIVRFKNKIEKEDTLKYHVERWTTLSSIYFRSFEISNNLGISNPSPSLFEHKTYISYTINDEKYVSKPDTNLDYFHETGISYQVRDLLLDLIKMPNKKLRYLDDKLNSTLAENINQQVKLSFDNIIQSLELD